MPCCSISKAALKSSADVAYMISSTVADEIYEIMKLFWQVYGSLNYFVNSTYGHIHRNLIGY